MRIIGGAKGAHCLYPLQIDPYYNGCKHACAYCYASQLAKSMGFRFDEYKSTNVDLLRSRLKHPKGKWREFIEAKHPIRLGGMSDPFTDAEASVTRLVIETLNEFEYPYMIFTKSDRILECLDIIDSKHAQVQISVSTKYEHLLEPGAPENERRFAACKTLSDAGIKVIGRLAPIIPLNPDGMPIYNTPPVCDSFDFDFIEDFELSGAKGIIAEMMRLTPLLRKNKLYEFLHIDRLVTDRSIRKGSTIFFSEGTRLAYYELIQDLATVPVTWCDATLWRTDEQGDCCQFV